MSGVEISAQTPQRTGEMFFNLPESHLYQTPDEEGLTLAKDGVGARSHSTLEKRGYDPGRRRFLTLVPAFLTFLAVAGRGERTSTSEETITQKTSGQVETLTDEVPSEYKLYIPLFTESEIEDPLETYEFRGPFPISEGGDGGIEKRALDMASDGVNGCWVWHQADREFNNEKGYWYIVYRVYLQIHSSDGEQAEKVSLAEWSVLLIEGEERKEEPVIVYRGQELLSSPESSAAGVLEGEDDHWSGNPKVVWNSFAENANGEIGAYYAFFWHNERGEPNIAGWKVSRQGEKIGRKIEFETNNEHKQLYPSVAVNTTDGSMIVAWQEYSPEENRYQIFAQRFDKDGQKIGDSFQACEHNWAQHPQLVYLEQENKFLLIWLDAYFCSAESDGVTTYTPCGGIYAQLLLANGERDGKPFLVNRNEYSDKGVPHVAVNQQGETLVVCSGTYQEESRQLSRILGWQIVGYAPCPLVGSPVLAEEHGQNLLHPDVVGLKDCFVVSASQSPPGESASNSKVWVMGIEGVSPFMGGPFPGERIQIPQEGQVNQFSDIGTIGERIVVSRETNGESQDCAIHASIGERRNP